MEDLNQALQEDNSNNGKRKRRFADILNEQEVPLGGAIYFVYGVISFESLDHWTKKLSVEFSIQNFPHHLCVFQVVRSRMCTGVSGKKKR